jgi:hypothetical protein
LPRVFKPGIDAGCTSASFADGKRTMSFLPQFHDLDGIQPATGATGFPLRLRQPQKFDCFGFGQTTLIFTAIPSVGGLDFPSAAGRQQERFDSNAGNAKIGGTRAGDRGETGRESRRHVSPKREPFLFACFLPLESVKSSRRRQSARNECAHRTH